MGKSVKTPEIIKNNLTSKRFVIRKALVGTNTVITFVNKKGIEITYDHDVVYNALKDKFDSMECFNKYKSYTNTNDLPVFVRSLPSLV
jgi:hypothetical protein